MNSKQIPTSLDQLQSLSSKSLLDSLSRSSQERRIKRLPATEEVDEKASDARQQQQILSPPEPQQQQSKKKRNSNRMKITNRKLYSSNGASSFSFDPDNDLLDEEYDDEEEEEDDDEDDELVHDDEDDEDDNEFLTRRFGMAVLQKSLLAAAAANNKDLHLTNKPSDSPTTDPQLLLPLGGLGRNYLDEYSHEALPLPGPPRDLIAQIVRPRFVTLSWMDPGKHPDEVVSYDVFYKMTTSDR